ncbi:hypothetical protein TNCV_2615651 [Trichonephila clavipes]|nr:hypothetical protein TNCV_2615651 [Trichonephila clavipes]
MTSARGQGAIVYCLNSGSDDSQTGRHNGDGKNRDERQRSPALDGEKGKALPWIENHERRALVGTDGKRALKKGLSPRLEWKDDEHRWR